MNSDTTEATKTPYTPEEQEIIDGLKACQDQLKLTNEDFATEFLKTYTVSTWSKLKRGEYEAKNRSKTMAELKSALTSIRRRIVRQLKATQGETYYELDVFSAMFKAVKECLEKKGENRLIFYVAQTGRGKSRFISELETRQTVTSLRANEPWSGSYYFAVMDILEALEVTGKFNSAWAARREMLEKMRSRVEVLAIDEGNYFGPKSINLVKDILNETEWTVFIALTPERFAAMKRHYVEWSQLQRRIHRTFRAEALTAADVGQFLHDAGLNGDTKSASLELLKAANEFGGFDFINRVTKRLGQEVEAAHPTLADVKAAIVYVKAELDRQEKGNGK